MTIKLIIDNVPVPIEWVYFSDKASSPKLVIPDTLKEHESTAYFSITVDPVTPVDKYLWEILVVANAVNTTFPSGFNRTYLVLPYLPYGRADRIFEHGNGHPLEIFIDLVLKEFTNFHFTDPHSSFALDLIKTHNATIDVRTQAQCFIETVGRQIQSGDLLVAPDEGASKKIYDLHTALQQRGIFVDVVQASKVRDIQTGKVVSTELPADDYAGRNVWIVDDILDGGGTFIPLAQRLKDAGVKKVNLYVTHGIFSKGFQPFYGLIDEFHVYQCVGTFVNLGNIKTYNTQCSTAVTVVTN